jgi:hypothetical protein
VRSSLPPFQLVPAMRMMARSKFAYSAGLVPWSDSELDDLHKVYVHGMYHACICMIGVTIHEQNVGSMSVRGYTRGILHLPISHIVHPTYHAVNVYSIPISHIVHPTYNAAGYTLYAGHTTSTYISISVVYPYISGHTTSTYIIYLYVRYSIPTSHIAHPTYHAVNVCMIGSPYHLHDR